MSSNKSGLCSICCLGYNHAKFLTANIEAIWKGDYKHVEIIALDDGSKDNSVELLNGLAKKSPCPMTVVAQDNSGNIGRNFNTAAQRAGGEYVTFIALDDVLYPDALSRQIKLLEADHSLAFVASSKITGLDEQGRVADLVQPLKLDSLANPTDDDLLNLEYAYFETFYIQGTVFRKSVIDAVGGFDEDMSGDDIVLRTKVFLYLKANPEYSFKILEDPTCYYRIHGSNVHKNTVRQVQIVSEYLDKYWPDADLPETLIAWAVYGIKYVDFSQYIKMFTFNPTAAKMLLEAKIQNAIKQSVIESRKTWWKVFYEKKKFPDGKREIILLSCLKFPYSKKSRAR